MTDTAATILRRARELISRPECWVQGAFAEDRDGHECEAMSGNATGWCASGALLRATGGCENSNYDLQRVITEQVGTKTISEWNDEPSTTHADVLAAFDRAIAAAEEDPA